MPSFKVALIALAFLTVPAAATAVSSVQQAFWQADFAWYDDGVAKSSALPDGIVLTCSGTATREGAGGCRDSATATVVSSSGVWEATTVDRRGGLLLQNIGGAPVHGVFGFTARFGSFYPALSGSGASVDDGARESADYFTVVDGAGGFDLHGCTMASAPGHSGPHACRPTLPEYQDSMFTLDATGDWTDLIADWRIYIQVSATGLADDPVPEPPALAVFLVGAVMACRRMARSPFRQSRRPSWWKARLRPRP